MVEQSIRLDTVFSSLAHHVRRDMLKRVIKAEQSISALAEVYDMSFAAVAKHVTLLEGAGLVKKRKEGRQQIISANPKTIAFASQYLEQYHALWNSRFDALDAYLKQ